MKLATVVFSVGVVLSPLIANAQSTFYGPSGGYQGRMDDRGNLYGPSGGYQGRISR